ncbi:hypothetical protein [Haloarchaeobius sp. HME9146]|uniref:hypothetical protein n=1 Tax=Haloarchaeobius sp. HME9146 TaxID=2978732 RepID=UPI0021C007C1|nr:hypothetical protein [Haloarchaeobius sp. HME9146]MCT9097475.1 hypothetical protein [Haloarchaeobius sp. HME9146]
MHGDRYPSDLDDRTTAILRRSNQRAYNALRLVLLGLLVGRLVRDRELDRGLLGALLASTVIDALYQLYYQVGGYEHDRTELSTDAVEVTVE